MVNQLVLPSEAHLAFARLYERFGIVRGGSGAVFVSRVIQPVTQIDEVLRNIKAGTPALDLTGAGGTLVAAYTVPLKKVAHVLFMLRKASTGVGALGLKIGGVSLELEAGGAALAVFLPTQDIKLRPNDVLGAWTTANPADSARALHYIVAEEDEY